MAIDALRFTRLSLTNWRNFTSVVCDLERRVFLVGPNASGKSNMLDVFWFLHELVTVGGGFQAAVEKRGGVSRLRCLAARQNPGISIEVFIGTDASPSTWVYELVFSLDSRRHPIITSERVSKNRKVIIERPNQNDKGDHEQLTQTYLEQKRVNQEFREVADFFASIRYLHIVPQLVREPERSVGKRDDPYGGDFLEQIARTPDKLRSARLERIQDALSIAVPQLKALELWRDPGTGTPHLRGKYEHWRPRGAWQTEEQFSDGTLRLLGLLWSIQDKAGPLLLEEPELSLHSEVVRYVPQMFARLQQRTGRQVIVSTHSTELLNDTGIGLDEVLVLNPEREGTQVHPVSRFEQVKALVEGGVPLAEAVIPLTRPRDVHQLSLFADRP